MRWRAGVLRGIEKLDVREASKVHSLGDTGFSLRGRLRVFPVKKIAFWALAAETFLTRHFKFCFEMKPPRSLSQPFQV